MEFNDHFSSVASSYAAHRPGYPEELFRWLAAVAPRHELAWDCACGTGQAARPLAKHFSRVVATDASAAQVSSASDPSDITFAVALAHQAPLADQTADLITVAQALHWFADEEYWAEVRRIITPGGVFAAWTYGLPRLGDAAVEQAMLRFYFDTVGPFWPPERQLVMDGYASLDLPFEELEPPSIRMEVRWTLPQLLGFLRSWSATARFIAAYAKDPVTSLAGELETLWGDTETLGVSWPVTIRAGRPRHR